MDNDVLERLQALVKGGLGYLVVGQIVEYIESQLTPEQLAPLGNLNTAINKMVSKPDTDIKLLINGLIELAKRGVIKERRG